MIFTVRKAIAALGLLTVHLPAIAGQQLTCKYWNITSIILSSAGVIYSSIRAAQFSARTSGKILADGATRKIRAISLFKIALAVGIGGILSMPASATSESNKIIAHLGAQGLVAYTIFTVPPIVSCAYDTLYVDITTDSGKSYYAILLTAYSTGRVLSRVDYTNTGGTCYINLVEM